MAVVAAGLQSFPYEAEGRPVPNEMACYCSWVSVFFHKSEGLEGTK